MSVDTNTYIYTYSTNHNKLNVQWALHVLENGQRTGTGMAILHMSTAVSCTGGPYIQCLLQTMYVPNEPVPGFLRIPVCLYLRIK